MISIRSLGLLALVVACWLPVPAQARHLSVLTVETRNLYLGADLAPVIAAPPELFLVRAAEALGQVAANDFRTRAAAIASELAETRPHVIGIQEAFLFTLDLGGGPLSGFPPFLDMLAELQAALTAAGLDYVAVASVDNIDLQIPGVPVPGLGVGTVRVLDRDVILVRADLASRASPVSFPCPRPKDDGCNFSFVAPLPALFGGNIERGFVGVDVRVGRRWYRVVNTHLEVQNPDPSNPASAFFQSAQAAELIQVLEASSRRNRLVVLGDFNSSPDDGIAIPGIVPPYIQMRAAGYTDAWNRNLLRFHDPEGFTCCQLSDLSNPTSILDERIDLIFVKRRRLISLAAVTGVTPLGMLPNWASDHAGVFGLLLFR